MINVDDIYLGSGGPAPREVLDKYGPHIDQWPTGYKTIGFGELKQTEPAAAYCIGAIGGLALLAEADVSYAASALSEAVSKGAAGVILQSTTMVDALDNIRHGGGLKATLAIATNITDRNTTVSLRDALLSPSTVGDVAAIEGSFGLKGSSKTASSANQLATTDGSTIVDHSRKALLDYVRKRFGKGPYTDEDLLVIHAYTALLQRTKTLPSSVANQAWQSGLLDAYGRLEGRYAIETLGGELHESCLEEVEKARGGNAAGRRGIPIGKAGGLSLPIKKRSTADAVLYRVDKGIPSRATSNKVGANATGDSYTALETGKLEGNLHLSYSSIITEGFNRYRKCVEIHEAARARRQQTREQVRSRLYATSGQAADGQQVMRPGLYDEKPHLDPQRLAHAKRSELSLINLIRDSPVGTALEILKGEAYMPSRGSVGPLEYQQIVNNWRAEMAAVIAAVSVEQGEDGLKDIKSVFATQKHLPVQILEYVRQNIGLFREQSLDALPAETLAAHGLNKEQLAAYNAANAESGEAGISRIEAPPLPLCILVADIINFNNRSVLPMGVKSLKLPGRQNEIDDMADAAGEYLVHHYHITGKVPSRKLTGLLLECNIAERRGFLEGASNPEEMYKMAQRIRSVAGGIINPLQKRNFPKIVLDTLNRCDQILGTEK